LVTGRSILSRSRDLWADLRTGFLFRPLVVAFAIAVTAPAVDMLDRWLDLGQDYEVETAKTLLTALIGSLITVLGVTFTLTVVTVQLVSSQFTPRALRGLVARPVPQLVAGIVIGTTFHGILTLLAFGDDRVPTLSALVTIALAVLSLLAILYFVHYTSRGIQLENLVAEVAGDTLQTIDSMVPDPYAGAESLAPPDLVGAPIIVVDPGFVQRVDTHEMTRVAAEHGVRVTITIRPGAYCVGQSTVGRVEARPGGDTLALAKQLARSVIIDAQRDLANDPGCGLEQLADMAVRALSPGVNDSTTALTCINWWGAALTRVAQRSTPAWRVSEHDRVYWMTPTFEDLFDARIGELIRFATPVPRVLVALVEMLGHMAACAAVAGADDRVQRVHAAIRDAAAFPARTALPLLVAERGALDDAVAKALGPVAGGGR
jgi:uncharacterized membrane protein